MMWRVGNGKSIRIWDTKWLSIPSTFRVQTPVNTLDSNALVENLIESDTKSWKCQLIFQVFTSENAEVICKIPLNLYGAEIRYCSGLLETESF